jgi:protein phosphatase
MTKRISVQLRAFADTDAGLVRSVNQDAIYCWAQNPEEGSPVALLMVADGMGGYRSSELASQLAVDTAADSLRPLLEQRLSHRAGSSAGLESAVRETIGQANTVIYRYAQQGPRAAVNMGTTIACVAIQGAEAIIANVGDSRVYLLEESGLEQLTEDHSVAGELVEEGFLDPEDILDHPQRNLLTRALGLGPEVKVDVDTLPLRAGHRLLLCTDGLWGMIYDLAQLEEVLYRGETPETATRGLIALAKARGGEDNISVVVCDVGER